MSEPSAPPPPSASTMLDKLWMETLFPNKDASKREAWLKILLDNEFEEICDLKPLSTADWDSLGLPLAVKTKMKQAVDSQADSSSSPDSGPTSPTGTSVTTTTSLTTATPVGGTSSDDEPEVTQIDCIVMDVSSSMRARSTIDADKTREDVSKLLFHTLVDKLVSLELSHAVGLVAFGAQITPIAITREYERFHDELGRLTANQGRTKLYDSIFTAAQVIETYLAAHCSKQKELPLKRIFVLTDGEDNASENAPWQVAQFLQQKDIILDAIPVAGHNKVLQSMTTAAAGHCFEVVSQEQGMELFQREAALHVSYREKPAVAPRPINNLGDLNALQIEKKQPVQDIKSAAAPVLKAPVLTQADVESKVAASSTSSGGNAAVRRILKEYKDFMNSPPPGWSAFVSASDTFSWKAVMEGPSGTPYEGGNFLVTIQFPPDYPFKPPKVRFATRIFHCNINSDGGICLDILKDQWSPALTISKIFLSLSSLMTDPNPDDPLDAYKGQLYKDNQPEYNDRARQATKADASLTFVDLVKTYNLNT